MSKQFWIYVLATMACAAAVVWKPAILQLASHYPACSGSILAGWAVLGAALDPKPDQSKVGYLSSVKALILVSFLVIAVSPGRAQSLPNNIYAAGASYNPGGSPSASGTALYAHLISNDLGTYGFTVFDAFPVSAKPFTVNTNVGGGVAQKVFTIGKIPIFVPTNAGISFNGKNTGWSWSTGGMASIKLKGNWRIFPNARWQKSTVSNGSGVQLIAGVLLGWGK